MHNNAVHIIHRLHNRWICGVYISFICIAAGIAVLMSSVLHYLFVWSWMILPVLFAVLFMIQVLLDHSWRINEKEVIRFLNSRYPAMEESAALLLQEPSSLLETLQRDKTAEVLQQIEYPSVYQQVRKPLLFFIGAMLLSVVFAFTLHPVSVSDHFSAADAGGANAIRLPSGVKNMLVRITPPSYTGKKIREQQSMNLEPEEGSLVHWQIALYAAAQSVQFVYNDSATITLHPANSEHTKWETDRTITASGFYQLKTDNNVSELYTIETIKDQAPVIVITSPKPSTVIEYGEPQKINLQAVISDDYGIADAFINATVAKGSGEAVTFKQEKIPFDISFAGNEKKYALLKNIPLHSLGMAPGDELYFYIDATDNHGQEKRSDILIVTLADTAQLMSMDGLLNGINLKPDYFRSQRQIIIETEELLKQKDTVPAERFHNRSNNLGIDQKLLRLRYGKFLGEEASSNEDGAGNNLGDPADFGNAATILDAFTDKHDNSEDATFLDPETKKQLKATLTEMWNSELRLRIFKPEEALPYEYKALRLLKDLQQKSRAYVAKSSSKTPPIKLEKRLTGKLEKITEPVTRNTIVIQPEQAAALRNALRILEQMKKNNLVDEASLQSLRLASLQLSNAAAKDPRMYLSAFESMKRIVYAAERKQTAALQDIENAEKSLQKLTAIPLLLPSAKPSPHPSLSRKYFDNLQKKTNADE